MKSTIKIGFAVILMLFGISSLWAQSEETNKPMKTLFSNPDGSIQHGGYLGIVIGYSEVDQKPAIEAGGRLAWVINHRFALGFAGKGFFNDLEKSSGINNSDYNLAGGYGGLFFQPIIFPKAPVHVSFPILLGAGGVSLNPRDEYNYHWDYDNYDSDYSIWDTDYFLVLEPGIDVEFNVLRYLRMSLGASYRFTNNIHLRYDYTENDIEKQINVDPQALNNFTFRMALMVGWF
jgi:hypothetical protein